MSVSSASTVRANRPQAGRAALARAWREGYELLSSMRFAIVLLSIISIASVIGTVLAQQQSLVRYVDAFGPFWTEVFLTLGLQSIYSAWWFLLILAFLVLSTSLCLARNTPKYWADMRRFNEHLRASSLRAMPFQAQLAMAGAPAPLAERVGALLRQRGWRVRLQQREGAAAGWMVAAKQGAAHKLGYVATHGAIVLICLGGLIDGDLPLRLQLWLGQKAPFTGTGMLADVPARYRLPADNPSFRGNILVNEGTRSGTAMLNVGDGVVLQELPFLIELERFDVEYYSTGMPRVFASDVVIHDRATGQSSAHRIAVNHPLRVHGVDIFQSSFDDGGSRVTLQPVGLMRRIDAPALQGTVGASMPVGPIAGLEGHMLEVAELRVLNVENLGNALRGGDGGAAVDVRRVDLRSRLEAHLGAGNKTLQPQDLRNVGPSISYRLRDGAGQAIEFHNYMLAIDLGDGVPVYLLGLRRAHDEAFSYLRVPQDQEGSMQTFTALLQALQQPQQRAQAVQRYVEQVVDADRPDLQQPLRLSAQRVLDLFAGAAQPEGAQPEEAGLVALSRFVEAQVPDDERMRASEVLLRILNGVLFELLQHSRGAAGLAPLDAAEPQTQDFMRVALFSLSDAYAYPAPVFYALDDFTQVQASVFQVTRAPGRYVVYTGCLLLIVGVFMMLYVRELRAWVWLPEGGLQTGVTQASLALTTNRRTLDTQRAFAQLQAALQTLAPPGESAMHHSSERETR